MLLNSQGQNNHQSIQKRVFLDNLRNAGIQAQEVQGPVDGALPNQLGDFESVTDEVSAFLTTFISFLHVPADGVDDGIPYVKDLGASEFSKFKVAVSKLSRIPIRNFSSSDKNAMTNTIQNLSAEVDAIIAFQIPNTRDVMERDAKHELNRVMPTLNSLKEILTTLEAKLGLKIKGTVTVEETPQANPAVAPNPGGWGGPAPPRRIPADY